jgi:hypothetical protein
VKPHTTLTVGSTIGWEKGLFIRCDDEPFIIDKVLGGSTLLVHKPGRFETFWRSKVNRIRYYLRYARWRRW